MPPVEKEGGRRRVEDEMKTERVDECGNDLIEYMD